MSAEPPCARSVRASVAAHFGAEVRTEGDSFSVVFDSPSVAVNCAVAVQRALAAHEAERPERRLRVGIGLHTGEMVPFDDQFAAGEDYFVTWPLVRPAPQNLRK